MSRCHIKKNTKQRKDKPCPYMFEALNDLFIIIIMNHLEKASIGSITIMSTCVTNAKISIINSNTTKYTKSRKHTNGRAHASLHLDRHYLLSYLDVRCV
jgi:hypothetical protein